MWLELTTIRRLALFIFLSVLLQGVATAQQTDTLQNVSSTIFSGPLSNVSLHSTARAKTPSNTKHMETATKSKDKHFKVNSTASQYAIEATSKKSEERREPSNIINVTLVSHSIPPKPSSAAKPFTISHDFETTWVENTPQKSEMPMQITSSVNLVDGKTYITDIERKTRENLIDNMTTLKPKPTLVAATALKIALTLQISETVKYSKGISEIPLIQTNPTSSKVRQASKTVVLEPSPSMITKQNRSKVEIVFTSSAESMSMSYSESTTKDSIDSNNNDTGNLTKVMTKENVIMSYSVPMLENETLTGSPSQVLFSSEMHIPSDISHVANHTTITRYTTSSEKFSKILINQTQIKTNFTKLRTIRPSSILTTSFYKAFSNNTETIKVSPSITIVKKLQANVTELGIASTGSVNKIKISDKSEKLKSNSTASYPYSTLAYSTPVPTTPTSQKVEVKEQQFRVTLKITSEQFKEEYLIKDSREFKQKSRAIEAQFKIVFQNMHTYLFAEVLRFFDGSLGCDVIIHIESKESGLVSVDEINNVLDQAKNTEGGFGDYVVGDIDVQEEDSDVQGRDGDKDEKKTWGRMPIIVVSVLGGVCLVLIVVVISQCIQRRHYSHSLADSNEIQEYSPAILVKNNDDSVYKDEERIPMTTFNQTDIY